jgi:hypothetical protein
MPRYCLPLFVRFTAPGPAAAQSIAKGFRDRIETDGWLTPTQAAVAKLIELHIELAPLTDERDHSAVSLSPPGV